MKIIKKIILPSCLILFFVGCGSEEGDSDESICESSCVGSVMQVDFDNKEAVIALGEAGSEYIIMPFSLGSKASWDGGNSADEEINFTMSSSSSVSNSFRIRMDEKKSNHMNGARLHSINHEVYYGLRHELDRSFAKNIPDHRFWEKVAYLDNFDFLEKKIDRNIIETTANPRSLISYFQKKSQLRNKTLPSVSLTTESDCLDEIDLPDESGDPFIIEDGDLTLFEGDDYCLYTETEIISGGDIDSVKAAVESMLETYRDTIYEDKFILTDDEYKFVPHIVVLDSEGDGWPEGFLGLYISELSKDIGRPIIYMPHDMSKIDSHSSITDSNILKRSWYATLVHEFQHSIVDYYRIVGGGSQEAAPLDEGLAHLLEDIFGFGDLIFESKVGPWLEVFPTGASPFLPSAASIGTDVAARGPMQALSFYLMSQKGGVEFADGKVSGGKGLSFIKSVADYDVKTSGPETYQNIMGGKLTDILGSYLGALVLDGRKMPEGSKVDLTHQTAGYQDSVADLTGNEDGIFGYTFNNFDQISQPIDINSDLFTELDEEGLGLSYFHTQPVLYKTASIDEVITITASTEIENTSVTVVRIK
jgi:hypothetical protein